MPTPPSPSLAIIASLLLVPGMLAAQEQDPHGNTGGVAQAPEAVQQPASTDEALIANALSAAPPAVAAEATVMGMSGLLREGTNGFLCVPDRPSVPNNSPVCVDAAWQEFFGALMARRTPEFEGIGIAYMLQGDMPASNVDPFAKGPTADNEWIQEGGPHIMILVSDPSLLAGMSSDPHGGGPFVMWRDTPYAHVMIPTVPREDD